jgi:hypothetical protein
VYTRCPWEPATDAESCDVPGCVFVRSDTPPAGSVPGVLLVVLDFFVRQAGTDKPVFTVVGALDS